VPGPGTGESTDRGCAYVMLRADRNYQMVCKAAGGRVQKGWDFGEGFGGGRIGSLIGDLGLLFLSPRYWDATFIL